MVRKHLLFEFIYISGVHGNFRGNFLAVQGVVGLSISGGSDLASHDVVCKNRCELRNILQKSCICMQ